jgi:light-regulated signal transduction histidine kinase (bacteriophytochrome)
MTQPNGSSPSSTLEEERISHERLVDTLEKKVATGTEDLATRTEDLATRTEDLATRTEDLAASVRELEAFAYTVSHDLRAPLRAMDGFSRILIEDFSGELPPEAQRYLNRIRENAQAMGQLITHLLDFSRLGRRPISRDSVDMERVVRQVFEDLETELEGRRVKLILKPLPVCDVDRALIKQVFANLIGNAVKYTAARDEAEIVVESVVVGDEVHYVVRDNGVGFQMEYVDNVFHIFERLHRSEDFEGTGLGLAIVKRIVEKHGGRAWAEAVPDQGASFYFTIGREGV